MVNWQRWLKRLKESRERARCKRSSAGASPQLGLEVLETRITPSATSFDIRPAGYLDLESFSSFAELNGSLYFRADDGATGSELWTSNGNAPTQLVDINPGANGSFPSSFTPFQGKLFFSANNGTNGSELWSTDGTAANTVMIKDINPGSGSSSPGTFAVVGSTLYFRATDGTNGSELWKTDGTAANTVQVKDIRSGSNSSSPSSLTNVNGTLYFTANDGTNGTELWKSNGTAGGTQLVKDIDPGSDSSNIKNLTNLNGTLVFSARDHYFYQYSPYIREDNTELWTSDGTSGGTQVVKEIRAGNNGSYANNFEVVNGTLFFSANDGSNGTELWKSDGTATNTVQVRDIISGSNSSGPSNLTAVDNTLFFRARNSSQGFELWKSDGTSANTTLVKDIRPGSSNSNPQSLTNVSGTLFFIADDGSTGTELWKSDGTSATTSRVADIHPGSSYYSYISNMTNINGTLFFSANDFNGFPSDRELWKSDGTTTTKLRSGGNAGSEPTNITDVNGVAFFTANDGANGYELWKSDGTSATLVKDINSGSGDSNPKYLTNVNGTLFFQASNGTNGTELWKSDGTAANTVMVRDIRGGSSSSAPRSLTNVNGTLLFTANDGSSGTELWKSDGTSANTVQVKDIRGGSGSSSWPNSLTNVNGTLFFTANNGTNGTELWKSDGTSANTVQVKDINPGGGYSYASGLTNVGGTLFFRAQSGDYDYELWKSDGTAANTVEVKDINPASDGSPTQLTDVNGTLFFRANDGTNGTELWKSDGTAANTVMVKDIVSGSGSGFPTYLTNVNGTLFFRANDGSNGNELWKSDGTAANTVQVANIRPGSDSSNPGQFVNLNGLLYFRADDGTNGVEIWRSDGVSASLAADIDPGAGGSNPSGLANVGGTLFFQAAFPGIGVELGVLTAPALTATKSVSDASNDSQAQPGEVLTYSVVVSSVGSDAATNVSIADAAPAGTTFVAGSAQITANTSGGSVTSFVGDGAGENSLQLDLSQIAAGGSITVTFDVTVPAVVGAGVTTISNAAQVSAADITQFDSNQVDINVDAAPSLAAVQSVSDPSPGDNDSLAQPGEVLTYTLVVSNTGDRDATSVSIQDLAPTGTTFVNGSAQITANTSGGSVTSFIGNDAGEGSLQLDLDTLVGGGGSITVTYQAQVDAAPVPFGSESIDNTAQVQATGISQFNSNQSTITLDAAPSFAFTKSVSDASNDNLAQRGEVLTYTLVLTNNGDQDADSVSITDAAPTGTTFVNGSAQITANTSGGSVTTFIGDDAGEGSLQVDLSGMAGEGGSIAITFQTQVDSPIAVGLLTIDNTAQASATGISSFNSSAASIDVEQRPNLLFSKSVSDASSGNNDGQAQPGETLTYTLVLSNDGNQSGTNVQISDAAPTGATFVAGSAQITADTSGGSVTNFVGDDAGEDSLLVDLSSLAAGGGSLTITFQASVDSPAAAGLTSISNTAQVSADGIAQFDSNAAAYAVDATPDLGITKSVSDAVSGNDDGLAQPGETLTYTLVVSNSGDRSLANVSIQDLAPSGTTFEAGSAQITADTSGGSVTNFIGDDAGESTLQVDLDTLAGDGGSLTVTFRVLVVDPAPTGFTSISNSAEVSATGVSPVTSNTAAINVDAASNVTI